MVPWPTHLDRYSETLTSSSDKDFFTCNQASHIGTEGRPNTANGETGVEAGKGSGASVHHL